MHYIMYPIIGPVAGFVIEPIVAPIIGIWAEQLGGHAQVFNPAENEMATN